MKPKSKTVLALVATCTMHCGISGANGELLYQWNFNRSDGSNTGTGSGGTLTANVGTGATTGSFSQSGVSGNAWDHCLQTSNAHDNWWGSDIGNSAAVSSLNLSTLNQFTITMWVKRSGGNDADLLNIGSTTTPGSSSNPGISIGLNGNWNNGMRVGVNGYNAWTGDLWGDGYNGNWVFVAIAYNGLNNNLYWDPTMAGLYGSNDNGAIITGDTSTSASLATTMKITTRWDWWNDPSATAGVAAVGSTATAFLANDGANANGFSGNLDDVRIYNSLLSVAEIEAVRQSAFVENLYWKGDVDDSWASLNWASDIAGNVPGGALPTDGSAAVAFATTGAANLTNVLGTDQNVKSIVATAGSGSVAIGGTHSLTLGADGIWLDLTAGGLNIATAGGVILNANQTWINKSPNPLTVNSALSGSGTLTKSGLGLLRLGGDNSLHTGGMVVEEGSLAIDHANALGGASASLAMNGGTLDLNGFAVTLGALSGTNGAIIDNSSATPGSLTLDVSSNSTYACSINDGPGSGPVSLVKRGSANVTSSGAGNFTGPVTIENGQFIANHAIYGGAPTSSSLGNLQVSGRTITVTYPGSLALTNNNIFGNQNANPSLLPEILVNATSLSANNYNLIGNITLNGATLSQTTSNSGNFQGYQFKGVVKVTGTAGASYISGSGGNHLSSNTIFDVAEVTGDAGVDLTVSTPLIDQSGDFGSAPGGLTKTGAGTMRLSAASTYTGNTVVIQGVLSIDTPSLSDTGELNVAAGATLNLNTSGATDTVGSLVLAGITKHGGTYGAIGSGAQHETPLITGTGFILVAGAADPYADWIATFPSLAGPDAARSADPDGDGLTNIQEFAFNSIPDSGAASGKIRSSVETIGSVKVFVLTLPVRDGAVFSGDTPATATLVDEKLGYRIEATNDLTTFDQAVSEVVPAASSGLPALDAGWTYRSFRLNGNIGGTTPRGPRGFLRAVVIDIP